MAMLGDVGRTTLWKLVKANELEQVNIGRRSFITAESLQAYVDRLRGSATKDDKSASITLGAAG
ncbi:helix-turn-helix domain-containing protein [Mycolicibacterium canariasense]|nr:helix-turn-helix domain-containing protein [Mycolicibacterium canariasense]